MKYLQAILQRQNFTCVKSTHWQSPFPVLQMKGSRFSVLTSVAKCDLNKLAGECEELGRWQLFKFLRSFPENLGLL